MSRRKDDKGRVLKTGESQRKDLIYQYRYTDILGKRKTIYAATLEHLREKEKCVLKEMEDGIDYAAEQMAKVLPFEAFSERKSV